MELAADYECGERIFPRPWMEKDGGGGWGRWIDVGEGREGRGKERGEDTYV